MAIDSQELEFIVAALAKLRTEVGRAVVYIVNLPLDTNVLFLTVMANLMPFVGRG